MKKLGVGFVGSDVHIGGYVKAFGANPNVELLAACDVLISFTSTSLLEAIILGRKTICVNFSDEEDRFPFVADGGSLPGRSTEQIEDSLEKLLNPEFQSEFEAAREKFLQYHVGPTASGTASLTLTSILRELIRNHAD